ncbi:exocyst complex component 8-like [Mytilus californianus]|uniref:exocyst complex component 8-like n=1 Tax=Mytilus californianus TaxID=6549 RepID=UPI002246DAD4|nr:exocyst complex component 8-like [Mytilus californianus]
MEGRVEHGLARVLSKQDFDPDHFVSKQTEGGEDQLLDMKQKVQILSDETAHALKHNVYKNYSQFIETAKEISILEGEMYQLSHILTEEKSLMSSMMEMSLVSDKAIVEQPKEQTQENPEEDTRKNLAFLLEKVEGCSSVTEVPGRHLIHNGDLAELDAESFTQIQKVHAFLLNDSLMIATWLPNRRGPVRYRFQGLYELDSLAIVNVRDAGPIKNAFKILMFPDAKMYQADGAKAKRHWLDILEETKKAKASRDKQKKEAAILLAEQQAHTPEEERKSFPIEDDSETMVAIETDCLNADWIQELPEDLDMCIAQRDFEGAVDLVEKVNEYLKDCPKVPVVKEFRSRIDNRIKQLTEGLMGELQVSPERSLRGGPRAARRAVTQLIRLGKSAQACDLFLKNRSAIIKYNIRQLKFEGATTLYIRRLCDVFFPCLSETGKEFTKAFQDHYGCMSAFVVWAKEELEMCVNTFNRHVFGGKSTLTVISECVQTARQHCDEQLCSIGFDVSFVFEDTITPELERVVQENREQMIEGIKYRGNDDKWRKMNHLKEKECSRFLEEMMSVGLDLKPYVESDCFVALTMNTAQFAKICMTMTKDLLTLHTLELSPLITDTITEVFKAQLLHFEDSLKNPDFKTEHKFILKNAKYVLETLMKKVEEQFKTRSISFPKQLVSVSGKYKKLESLSKSSGS